MEARAVIGVSLLGLAAYGLWRSGATTLPGSPQSRSTTKIPGVSTPSNAPSSTSSYAAAIAARESANNPAAKNPRSSASGLYQFTRATWLALGGKWGPDPRAPFGGLAVSIAEQNARFQALTAKNAAQLEAAGIAPTRGALYAAHFLGAGLAARVLRAPGSTKLASLVGSRVMTANPHLRGFDVDRFRSWASANA